MKKKSTEQFIKEAKKIHGDKYDYSKVNYVSTDKPVEIICPIHGSFNQRPHDHLKGCGCKKCGTEQSAKTRSKECEDFINQAKKLHNNKYDYSKVNYINNSTEVEIVCPVHGVFEQIPYVHNKLPTPCGCPKCSNNIKKTTEQFIEEARVIFPAYNYSKTVYTGANKRLEIICPKHGSWFPKASDLLHNHGCPICNESKGEKRIRKWLTKNNIRFERQAKFENCKNKSLLPFDFYIPSKDLLIEFQGEEHYKPVKYFGGAQKFTKIQENDKIKKSYAEKEHNFLEISYKDFDKIENILNENILGG